MLDKALINILIIAIYVFEYESLAASKMYATSHVTALPGFIATAVNQCFQAICVVVLAGKWTRTSKHFASCQKYAGTIGCFVCESCQE